MFASENPEEFLDSPTLSSHKLLALIALFSGSISWFTLIFNWIREQKIDEYLKLVLFLTTLLICALAIFIFGKF